MTISLDHEAGPAANRDGERLPTKKTVTNERRAVISSLVAEGKILKEIIDLSGVSESVVRADLRKLGIDISEVTNKKVLSDREVRILELHEQGENVQSIADTLGLNYQQVWYSLSAKLSLPPIKKQTLTSSDEEYLHDAIRLIMTGKSAEDFELELGVTEQHAARLESAVRKAILVDCDPSGDRTLLGPHLLELSMTEATIEQISAATEVNPGVLRRIARDAGADEKWLLTEARRQRIEESIKLFESGLNMSEIAKKFGISREMTRQDLLAFGVDTNSMRVKEVESVAALAAAGKRKKEIAAELGLSLNRVAAIARSNDISITPPAFLHDVHGTIQSYNKGCRCKECKASNARRAAEYKESVKDRVMPEHLHGTTTGYNVWACRCEGCRKAGAEANRRQGDVRRGGKPARPRKSWTPEDDFAVMDYSKSAKSLAQEVGASVAGVEQRRQTLSKLGVKARNRK